MVRTVRKNGEIRGILQHDRIVLVLGQRPVFETGNLRQKSGPPMRCPMSRGQLPWKTTSLQRTIQFMLINGVHFLVGGLGSAGRSGLEFGS